MRTSLNKHCTIDSRLPACLQPVILRSFAIRLPIVDINPAVICEADQVIFCKQTEVSKRRGESHFRQSSCKARQPGFAEWQKVFPPSLQIGCIRKFADLFSGNSNQMLLRQSM